MHPVSDSACLSLTAGFRTLFEARAAFACDLCIHCECTEKVLTLDEARNGRSGSGACHTMVGTIPYSSVSTLPSIHHHHRPTLNQPNVFPTRSYVHIAQTDKWYSCSVSQPPTNVRRQPFVFSNPTLSRAFCPSLATVGVVITETGRYSTAFLPTQVGQVRKMPAI